MYALMCAEDEEGEGGTGKGGKQSKPEKKSRKAMQKLGMKPVPGVARVTIKKSKNVGVCAFPSHSSSTHGNVDSMWIALQIVCLNCAGMS